ncbi:MAG TPA: biotin/lipoyl-binding protein, partial [Chthoniobacteraceae bacterium]
MSSTVEKPTPGHTPDGDQAHRPPGDQSGNTVQPAAPGKKSHKRLFILGGGAILVLLLLWTISGQFGTVSTDDAYVNSHVTFVAPRVAGQVAKVLVDDNNRVRKGDVLVELDPEPFQVQVDLKQSAVDSAESDRIVAEASVRANIAQARSGRFKLQHAIESVNNQVALLRANAAAFEKSKATLALAQQEFDRYKQLLSTKVASKEEYDQHVESLDVAKAENNQAMENVTQSRVALGLPPIPNKGEGLADTPPDLDQTFSSVREAESSLMQSAAQLGVVPSSFDLKPKELLDEFYRRDPGGNIDRIYAKIITDAPALKQAESKLEVAKNELDLAKLNLRYCKIVSEIDGV